MYYWLPDCCVLRCCLPFCSSRFSEPVQSSFSSVSPNCFMWQKGRAAHRVGRLSVNRIQPWALISHGANNGLSARVRSTWASDIHFIYISCRRMPEIELRLRWFEIFRKGGNLSSIFPRNTKILCCVSRVH